MPRDDGFHMPFTYDAIATAVAAHGLAVRGGFTATNGDGVPECSPGRPATSVLMIGNTGRGMWDAFAATESRGPDPLDDWTREVISPIAAIFGATAIYPFDQPPFPFQRWAQRGWPLFYSPLGLLIDNEFGLWHALRAALLFPDPLLLPALPAQTSPCESCVAKPCLVACPIDAFSASGFDYQGCRDYLHSPASQPCRDQGCGARNACPVGARHRYPDAQVHFHMRAFRR